MTCESKTSDQKQVKFLPLNWETVSDSDKVWVSEPVGLYYHVFEACGIFRASCLIDSSFAGKEVFDTKEEAQMWCYKDYNEKLNKLIDHSAT